MIDNMPYVLAEASVMRIPLLIYDVGGVTEMIDPKQHADIICGTPKVGGPSCSWRPARTWAQQSSNMANISASPGCSNLLCCPENQNMNFQASQRVFLASGQVQGRGGAFRHLSP